MKKVSRVILLVLMFASILGNVVALSSVVERQITVAFVPLKYYFDTFPVAPASDKTGFIYNGTTYVPLRWMCETLGKEVSWDGSTYSIWVGRQPDGSTVSLSSLQQMPVEGDNEEWEYARQGITVLGQSFKEAYLVEVNTYWSPITCFYLDGKFSRFEGYFGFDPRYMSEPGSAVLIVKGDGEELYRVTKTSSEKADPISVDVTGVTQLTLEVLAVDCPYGSGSYMDTFIAEPILVR